MTTMIRETTLLSLPTEVLGEIVSKLSFYVVWFYLRSTGSSRLWHAIMATHSYPELLINRFSWPNNGPRLKLPQNLIFPALRRLCIHRPGDYLEISLEAVRNLPSTLVDIDIECQNAESFFVETFDPLSDPPSHSLCFRSTIEAPQWGLLNVNMGKRFPYLERLRLIGSFQYLRLNLPRDAPQGYLAPIWGSSDGRARPFGKTLEWTPLMAYNFVRELPTQTLKILHCKWLLAHAARVSCIPSIFPDFILPLPLPTSLTEVTGLDLKSYIDFEPSVDPSLEWTRTNCLQLGGHKHLAALAIQDLPNGGWWNGNPLPVTLTALTLLCPLKFGSLPFEAISLPPNLLSFSASPKFNADQIPVGWFPRTMTKLVLPNVGRNFLTTQLLHDLPPCLKYLSLGSMGAVDLKALPETILTLKLKLAGLPFRMDHIPPHLTKLHLLSTTPFHGHFPTSLRTLKMDAWVGSPSALLEALPTLTRLQIPSSSILEEDLPKLPYSLRRLEVGSITLNGSTLIHFPSSDKRLTSQKWEQLLSKLMPKTIQLPIWDFRPWTNQPFRMAKVHVFPEVSPLYLPPYITEIDFGDMDIQEAYVLDAIETQKLQIISIKLKSVSLAPALVYPQSLTYLEATEYPKTPGQDFIRVSRDRAPPFGSLLKRLIIPLVQILVEFLPPNLIELSAYSVFGTNLTSFTRLETLVLYHPVEGSLITSNSLTCLKYSQGSLSSDFGSDEFPNYFKNLKILKAPRSSLSFNAIPKNLTDLEIMSVHDIPQETIVLALQKVGQKIENFTAHSISDLTMRYSFPHLKSFNEPYYRNPFNTVKDFQMIPDHARSVKAFTEKQQLMDEPPSHWPSNRPWNLASTPKCMVSPLLEGHLKRWRHLKVLDLNSGPLPHYVTSWLPRSLESLSIDNTFFSHSSYQNMPTELSTLVLYGSGCIRASFALALPRSLLHLNAHKILARAYQNLPQKLETLDFLPTADYPFYVNQLPSSLTALFFKGTNYEFYCLPSKVCASDLDGRRILLGIERKTF